MFLECKRSNTLINLLSTKRLVSWVLSSTNLSQEIDASNNSRESISNLMNIIIKLLLICNAIEILHTRIHTVICHCIVSTTKFGVFIQLATFDGIFRRFRKLNGYALRGSAATRHYLLWNADSSDHNNPMPIVCLNEWYLMKFSSLFGTRGLRWVGIIKWVYFLDPSSDTLEHVIAALDFKCLEFYKVRLGRLDQTCPVRKTTSEREFEIKCPKTCHMRYA